MNQCSVQKPLWELTFGLLQIPASTRQQNDFLSSNACKCSINPAVGPICFVLVEASVYMGFSLFLICNFPLMFILPEPESAGIDVYSHQLMREPNTQSNALHG